MKTLLVFFVILGIVIGTLAFSLFMPMAASLALLFYLLIGGSFIYNNVRNRKLRTRWQKAPVLADSPKFDDFFWQLTLVNQDWYIEKILQKEGLLRLIAKYETEIVQIWQNSEMAREDKIEKSNLCLKRLKTLSYTLDFNYGLRPY